MKKFIGLLGLSALMFASSTLAGGCFRDKFIPRNQAAEIKSAVNLRDVACMEGSTVVRSLPTGTKVRIIAESERYLVVDDQGNQGRVWRDFIKTASESYGIPNYPSNPVTSFCSTLNLSKCPYPTKPGEQPNRYYKSETSSSSSSTPTPQPIAQSSTNNNIISSNVVLSSKIKERLRLAVDKLITRLQKQKDPDEVVATLTMIKQRFAKIKHSKSSLAKAMMTYIEEVLEEEIEVLEIEAILTF